jgi:hypothetical protein
MVPFEYWELLTYNTTKMRKIEPINSGHALALICTVVDLLLRHNHHYV